jgi:hypothetical protein
VRYGSNIKACGEIMQPQQIITSGTLSQLPHFDPVAQLCGRSWATTTTKQVPIQLKHKAQSRTDASVKILFEAMGTKAWSVKELTEHVRNLGNTFKRDTVRDYLHILVSRKMVVKSIHGQPHKFWKSNA